jgi:thiamine kinase-like enzyme
MTELLQIVEKLAPALGEAEGEPQALEGGITNRNYRVTMGGKDYVIRVPGKDTSLLEIDRTAERDANQAAAEAGIAPPVTALLEDPPALVTEFVVGEEMSAEQLREPATLSEVAPALRAFHDSGVTIPTEFDSFRIVETYAKTAKGRGAELPDAYEGAHAHAKEIESAMTGPEHDPVPCHDDLLAANFLRTAEGIRIVDWEYAGMGDRYFDLANFSVNNELTEDDRAAVLEAYFGASPSAKRLADLTLMMFMSDFREAMWGVVQGVVSDLDFDFAEYADKHFTRMQKTAADPSFARALEDARAAPG